MPKIIILRGNSGSGKSTTAKALQKKLGPGTLLIPQDVVRREMLMVRDRENNPAIDLLINLVRFGYAKCDIMILEGILSALKYRRLFEVIETLFSGNIYAYYFDLSFEETLRRHARKPESSEYGEAEMRRWWLDQDLLTNVSSIHENRIREDTPMEAVVERMVRDLMAM